MFLTGDFVWIGRRITSLLMNTEFQTTVIHANRQHDQYGAAVQPIYQTSTFEFQSAEQGGRIFGGEEEGFAYTRIGNPSIKNLEGKIAVLEGAEDCVVTASGMGAIGATVLTLLSKGDHMVADNCLYGCTFGLFENTLPRFGIEVTFLDTSVPGAVREALKPNTKIVYFETPANPTMKIVDIKRVVEEAHSQEGVLVVIDNTFASPVLCRPLSMGVDLVIHSMTKYINGHSDVVGGCSCGPKALMNRIRAEGVKDITGSILSPHDAFLVIRGLNTLALRVRQASENAVKVAEFLNSHPAVQTVWYPGLPTHPGHDIAKSQMAMFGSMISFELKGGLDAGRKLLNSMKLIVLAVSLGGCESLIQHPASMTHAGIPREERLKAGLTDGLIRMAVGIEFVDDIIADLKQGLDKLV